MDRSSLPEANEYQKPAIQRGRWALDPNCSCHVCKNHSRSYIRHLFTVGEYTAGQLITYHNIHFYLNMMKEVRESILQGKFDEYFNNFYKSYQIGWKN